MCEATFAHYLRRLDRPTATLAVARRVYNTTTREDGWAWAFYGTFAAGVAIASLVGGLGLGGAAAATLAATVLLRFTSAVVSTVASIPARRGYARLRLEYKARRAFLRERPARRKLLLKGG